MGFFGKKKEQIVKSKEQIEYELEEQEIERRSNYEGDMICPYCKGIISSKLPNLPLSSYLEDVFSSLVACPHCKKVLGCSHNI